MPARLTKRQKEVLEFIKQFEAENESGPSLTDVASHFGIKLPTASKLVSTLNRKGFILKHRDSLLGLVIEAVSEPHRVETFLETRGLFFATGEVNWYDEPESLIWCRPIPTSVRFLLDDHFALYAMEDIPELFVRGGDLLLCNTFEAASTLIFPQDIIILKNHVTGILARYWGTTLQDLPLELDFIDRRALDLSVYKEDFAILVSPIIGQEEVRSVFNQWFQASEEIPHDVEILGKAYDLFRARFAIHPDEETIADFSNDSEV